MVLARTNVTSARTFWMRSIALKSALSPSTTTTVSAQVVMPLASVALDHVTQSMRTDALPVIVPLSTRICASIVAWRETIPVQVSGALLRC